MRVQVLCNYGMNIVSDFGLNAGMSSLGSHDVTGRCGYAIVMGT